MDLPASRPTLLPVDPVTALLGYSQREVAPPRAAELALLNAIDLPADGRVIDLGCGAGALLPHLLARVPRGEVVAVDIDEAALETARATGPVQTVHAWANALPLPGGIADLIVLRHLLAHHAAPREVLAEAYRLLRPGGWVFLVDGDDSGLLLHPEPPGLPRLLGAAAQSQRHHGGDRAIGRKLGGLLRLEGYEGVGVEVLAHTALGEGLSAFVEEELRPLSHLIDAADMAPAEVHALIAMAQGLARKPAAFGQALTYVAQGRRPG